MSEYMLEMRDITKRYPGVLALDHAHLGVLRGDTHCLVGENGTGKSTLMKILAGAERADSGDIFIEGDRVQPRSPLHAQRLGIGMIHQEFHLAPRMSVAENVFLGRLPARRGIVRWQRLYADTREQLSKLGSDLDPRRPVATLSVAQQQMVEIAKALSLNARILVMDEPSATLTDHELGNLFKIIKILCRQDISVIYISHRLEEVFSIGRRVTVMRDGAWIATEKVYDLSRDDLVRMMVGRELTEEFPPRNSDIGVERLRVERLGRPGGFKDVSLSLRGGEVVGLTGLVGSGRTEVARALFGADPHHTGRIFLDGKEVVIRSPRDAIRQGIGLLTEDRKNQGLVLNMSVRGNITLANMRAVTTGLFLSPFRENRIARDFTQKLKIKTPSVAQIVHHLSGGNQQKVVLAKWLLTQLKVLIFDEPTRGIDVGAKAEIYGLMNQLAEEGLAILVITSELPEALGICDRILVMREGALRGELNRAEANQEAIMQLATGLN